MTENSLTLSMDRAVEHYSSMFKLPPYQKMVSVQALLCISAGLVSSLVLFASLEGIIKGTILGVSLFLTNLILDHAINVLILRRDPIYDLRRTTGLSMFCWVFWLFFITIGAILAIFWGSLWWFRLCLLGFSAVIIFRLTVLGSTSSMEQKRILAASLLQPFLCIIPFLMIWAKIDLPLLLFLVFSLAVSIVSSSLFLSALNRMGKQTIGVPSLSLLKAFLLNWVVDLNAPFEKFLEELGKNQDVEVSMIKFDSSKPKAVLVIPSVHPGPFKNIGSSPFPSQLKTALEKKLDCVVCVPHGLLGHEFDLASQIQNQKVINSVIEHANAKPSTVKATPFVKVSNGLATACCQIFGNFAFLSFTLAPKTTEDFPQELGLFVRDEAEKHGLSSCAVVNAHNSIDGTVNVDEALDALKKVASECLEQAFSKERFPFEVGAATFAPKEFGLREGMGPGGITVVAVKVGGQKTAYVVVDGNNMITGLREKILSALSTIGIDDGEVFTTDTHLVNAIVLVERGYHPVGEVMEHEKLVNYIKEVTLAALSNLERVKTACHRIEVHGAKVIGEKLLETLCLLIDRSLHKAKRIVVPIFATSGLLLMLFLMFV